MLSFLSKTAQNISQILGSHTPKITKDALEEILLESDVDYDLVVKILSHLPKTPSKAQVNEVLQNLFKDANIKNNQAQEIHTKPLVELIIGVNGAGKTTTIAKLAKHYINQNKKVLLGAGDTFRAAAVEQLQLWAKKLQIPIIATQQGSDPSAIAFDSIKAGIARGIDNIIIDTAGRLHNQTNLQNELQKIDRTCAKALEGKPFRKILILDGTQGSSAINQARIFSQTIKIDGIIITKLDGTSKGGAIFSIVSELKIPIFYIGVGEGEDDLIAFCENDYINSILDCIFGVGDNA